MKEYICNREDTLLSFLEKENPDLSHKKWKALLTYKKIKVNGKAISQYNHPLKPKDRVAVAYIGHKSEMDLTILYEDKDLLVLNKRANLLTIASPSEKEKTLYHMALSYVKEENKNNLLFIVHRLDKETSGIVVFAKNSKIKEALQNQWNELVLQRKYYAIIEGKLENPSGSMCTYLKEASNYKVYSTTKKEEGKLAITKFNTIKIGKQYSLLDVSLETGRKNQIRVHMSELGHPIVGDLKYGGSQKPMRQMGLHAYLLEFQHPFTHKKMIFKIDMPREFKEVMKKGV